MSTEDRLNEAKGHLEKMCNELIGNKEKPEQYSLCMGLWCLTDALLQMQVDLATIKEDVRQIKHSQGVQ